MAGISSVDQVENWDSDEDDDGGPRPSELFGWYIWEVDKYSQITQEKLQSDVFEAGGSKWFVELTRGFYVSNHLSLLLCVANADNLLPGWSHLAHFAICVVNKASKACFYDELHRFWENVYGSGWPQFMELSKLEEDGFIDDDDTLVIKAYVQVIRESVDRPFPCLDPQYRWELIAWYRTEVDQILHDFVEERLAKLRKLIADISRWSGLCAFWSNVDPPSKRRMSRVKMDSILKSIVNHFPIDSKVAVFVMDSIYNGLKALKGQHNGKKSKAKAVDSHIAEEDLCVHFIRIENDSFILVEVDDALQLLERAASDPFPPKDEKGPQKRAATEEFDEDTDERDERRLTELGRQAIEIFVLKQIFREIEAAVNGTPSSPLYWDSDEDGDDDAGPKPSELYKVFRWEINKYSQITERSLQSKAFEAGGCKWFVMIYPEGYDTSSHLSLFLCVANADKLLPGWSHLAHYALCVVNKDSKYSYYYDELHRFRKNGDGKGWAEFMELSKLEDGFIDDDDTLVIDAYVQVIRERADRPFPCLDLQYRRIFMGWYRTKVEQIFHDFVEERLAKLRKLTEDISRWSSFCAFWSNVDPASRHCMSLVKMDSILKVIVKHFPLDSKVAPFVMDSIYNGLKTLKGKKIKAKAVLSHTLENLSVHFIRIEKDSFILEGDALQLLERAASNPFPLKDEKGPQDGATAEELHGDTGERDERRLTELGRQAIEVFILERIFREIEAAVNGTPSSPLCLDNDEDEDDNDDRGPKPSELYKMFRWEINKYSQITERCLRSKSFVTGGCKWFFLFNPEGLDESNGISLFLCVADYDRLLPGWSHLVHFTIGVVNKDPNKESFYVDTLHRFWKEEHDWGFRRFMGLSELKDGFIDDDDDTLIINAHVQVIRERVDQPFPCLDPEYKRLIARLRQTKVEFHAFVEDRLAKLKKLTEDKSSWSSFCAFWSNVDPASRLHMSRVEMDSTLKAIVKHTPIVGSVASIYWMDSIYNGLEALKGKKAVQYSHIAEEEEEDLSVHFIRIEKDSFILMEVDDALQLLERAVSELFPPKGPRDEAAAEVFDEDLDERRLTELYRQVVEIFVLERIFSKIEASYEEDVAFKKQGELSLSVKKRRKQVSRTDFEENLVFVTGPVEPLTLVNNILKLGKSVRLLPSINLLRKNSKVGRESGNKSGLQVIMSRL